MYGPLGKRNTGTLVKRQTEQKFNQYAMKEITEPNLCQEYMKKRPARLRAIILITSFGMYFHMSRHMQ